MKHALKYAGIAGLIGAALFAALPAWAQARRRGRRAAGTVNKGDTAWMLTSSVLVLMMSVPGLALFYGGLVRTKNMLSVLMQVLHDRLRRGARLGAAGAIRWPSPLAPARPQQRSSAASPSCS